MNSPKSTNRQHLQHFLQKFSAHQEQEHAQAILKAQQEAPGKEPFDITRLGVLYDLTGPYGELVTDEKRSQWLAYQYHVLYPEIQTLAEFAKLRDALDTEEAN